MIVSVGRSSNQKRQEAQAYRTFRQLQSATETIEITRAASPRPASSKEEEPFQHFPVKADPAHTDQAQKAAQPPKLGDADTNQPTRRLSAGFPPVGPQGPYTDLFGYRPMPEPRNRGEQRSSDRFDAVTTPRVRPRPHEDLGATTRTAPAPVRSMRFGLPRGNAYTPGTCVTPAAKAAAATIVRTRDNIGVQSAGDLLRVEDQEQRALHHRDRPNRRPEERVRVAALPAQPPVRQRGRRTSSATAASTTPRRRRTILILDDANPPPRVHRAWRLTVTVSLPDR